jgi:hypothetical protein
MGMVDEGIVEAATVAAGRQVFLPLHRQQIKNPADAQSSFLGPWFRSTRRRRLPSRF